MRRAVILLLLLAALPGASRAAPAEPELQPPPASRLPLDLPVRDEAGRPTTLRDTAGGAPLVLVFADYRCTVLCGTALGLLASVLPETALRPATDYALVAIGLDPRAGPADAAAMRRAQFGASTPLAAASHLLVAAPPAIAAATSALGYRAVWRGEADRFDHPLAVMVLAPDGRLVAALPGLGLDAGVLRDTLLEARAYAGGEGPLLRRVLLACRGFLPEGAGARGVALIVALAVGLAVALAGLGGFGLLLRAQRRRRA